jgi:PilZ domain
MWLRLADEKSLRKTGCSQISVCPRIHEGCWEVNFPRHSPGQSNITEARSRRRSERVVLRIPLQLSAELPDGRRINVEAHTLVVNAHGGLLDVGMEMVRGQQIRLRNLKTEIFTSGRVLRVEKAEEGGHFSVAFEFEAPCPQFWPVSFPPDDWTVAGPA